jgi:hypothetical protein
MKPALLKTFVALIALLSFTQCKKDETTFNASFYADWSNSDGALDLYIDEKLQGELPFMSVPPTCDNDSLKKVALNMPLKSGKYKIEAKNKMGVVKSSGKIKISSTRSSGSGGMGSQSVLLTGDCAIVGLSK